MGWLFFKENQATFIAGIFCKKKNCLLLFNVKVDNYSLHSFTFKEKRLNNYKKDVNINNETFYFTRAMKVAFTQPANGVIHYSALIAVFIPLWITKGNIFFHYFSLFSHRKKKLWKLQTIIYTRAKVKLTTHHQRISGVPTRSTAYFSPLLFKYFY